MCQTTTQVHTAALMLLSLCVIASTPSSAQTRKDTIRGRVTTDSGVAIGGADVIVTMAPTAEVFRTSSDSAGRYSVEIRNGTGEYLLYIGAVGRRAFRQRLPRSMSDTTFVIDAHLSPQVTALAPARIQAERSRPSRSLGSDPIDGAADGMNKVVDGVTGSLPPDLISNIEAMASTVPGLSVTSSGVSAFGLGPENNLSTLNGLAYGGADLPRDLSVVTRFATSPWDPTKGGFSGVHANQAIERGGNIGSRRAHVTIDKPELQISDNASKKLGQEFTNIAYSQGGTGAYVYDRLFYNYGFQLSRRIADAASLAELNDDALNTAGVARDSAQRLLQLLQSVHVPLNLHGIPSHRVTTASSLAARLDHAPANGPPGSTPSPIWWIAGVGTRSQSEAGLLGPFAPSTYTGTSASTAAVLQGLYSRYFGGQADYINETAASLSISDQRGAPYLRIPAGNVQVVSSLADGTTGLGSLDFGGNSYIESRSRLWMWEVVNQTDFLAGKRSALPLKLFFQSRLDGFHLTPPANRRGLFTFPSLESFAQNTPSSFSRSLQVPSPKGGEWTGAAALAGTWRTQQITLTGGVRLDANVFTTRPTHNARVQSVFGVRTEYAPNSIALSPRLGFTWNYGTRPGGFSLTSTQLSRIVRGPRQIRGGIGLFRSVLPATHLIPAMTATGLQNGTQRLLCIGPAVPTPTWDVYVQDASAIPVACVDSSNFADTTRSVVLFDPTYRPQQSWRATVGTTAQILRTLLAIDLLYSFNRHQPGVINLNFAGTPYFSLQEEGNRPVYVDINSVVPSSGTLSPVASRKSPAFGAVDNRVSDLKGHAGQLTVYAIPNVSHRLGVFTVGYTYAVARSQARGFDQNTGGDPRRAEAAPTPFTPRHQFVIQGAKTFGGLWGLTTLVRAVSGLPFTPLVSGDVNGDGLANDRAFIFDSEGASDPVLGSKLHSLVTDGPAVARECLARQIGRIAGRNSCSGPWSATMNAGLFLLPALPATKGRVRLGLTIANVLGGVDQMLHGAHHLRGWGAPKYPDQVLYRVRAFDPGGKRFLYDVNPRFGSSKPATTSLRNPFRVTVDVALDIGHSPAEQLLEQNLRLRPGLTGTRASGDSLKKRYMQVFFSNFYGFLISRLADSLALSTEQIQEIQRERIILQQRADSVYAELGGFLASLPSRYDRAAVLKRIEATNNGMWSIIHKERDFLAATLTPGQIRLLPRALNEMVTVPGFQGRFFYPF